MIAGIAISLSLVLGGCASKAFIVFGDDIARAGTTVADDVGRTAAKAAVAAQAAERIAARQQLLDEVKLYLKSDEWLAVKGSAKIAFKVSREEPICTAAFDAVLDNPAEVGGLYQSLANAAARTEGAEGLEADALTITAQADAVQVETDVANLAVSTEMFKDLYCD